MIEPRATAMIRGAVAGLVWVNEALNASSFCPAGTNRSKPAWTVGRISEDSGSESEDTGVDEPNQYVNSFRGKRRLTS